MKRENVEVVIYCATKNEAVAARRNQEGPFRQVRVGSKRATIANLGRQTCLTVSAGIGDKNLERAFQSVQEDFHTRFLLNFGAAGAINQGLPIGAMTLPREIIAYTTPMVNQEGDSIQIDVGRVESVHPTIRLTRCGSTPADIRSRNLRERIWEKLRLDTTDWETYPLASMCKAAGIDFLALRCVTDHADASTWLEYGRSAAQVLERGAAIIEPLVREWLQTDNSYSWLVGSD